MLMLNKLWKLFSITPAPCEPELVSALRSYVRGLDGRRGRYGKTVATEVTDILSRYSDQPRDADREELLSLVDGAYSIVELYSPTSPAGTAWRQRWLSRARRFGIYGE